MDLLIELRRKLGQYGLEWFNRYYASYKGVVVDNNDPKMSGRLLLSVAQVYGEQIPNYWALSKGVFSGKGIGFVAIPNVGDSVWVSFENGDPRYPIWEYGWFTQSQMPEGVYNGENGEPQNNVLQTTSGNRIELDDKEGLIRVTDKNGNILEMNDKGVSIISGKLSLGSLDGSAESAVLGDTAVSLLLEFMTDLGTVGAIPLAAPSVGPTLTLSASPAWSAIAAKWNNKWKTMKSNKVTLD